MRADLGLLLDGFTPGYLRLGLAFLGMFQLGASFPVVFPDMVRQRTLDGRMHSLSSVSIPQVVQPEVANRVDGLDKGFAVLVAGNEELVGEVRLGPLPRHDSLVLAVFERLVLPVARSGAGPRLDAAGVRYYPAAFDRSGSSQGYEEDGCVLHESPSK